MATLQLPSRNIVVADSLQIATNFKDRGVGLLGRSHLHEGEGLWIHSCNSIHTFFMKFSIDCVFVDKKLKVKAIRHQVPAWRWVLPIWGASSVFELPAGTAVKYGLSEGDQLYVGH